MHPMKTIDLYVSIAEASHHMVNAARASNWDELVSAEQECARRVAALRAHQESNGATSDAAEEKRRINILGEILALGDELHLGGDLTALGTFELRHVIGSLGAVSRLLIR